MTTPSDADYALDLTRRLIRCASVTPDEGGALALLQAELATLGCEVARPVFSEAGTPDVENLFARVGSAGPVLAFAGHTDVVPPGDAALWTHDPFAAAIADGVLYGRGVEDMKGGIACFIAALRGVLSDHGPLPGSVVFIITGDEEGPAINGSVKLLDWMAAHGHRPDHCLLGEPTNVERLGDMIKIGRRGSLSGTLTIHGRQGHVAYPQRADNPVRGLTRLLAALQDTPLDAGTAHFLPSNLEFTTVDVGNPAGNVIPATATARFNIRFNDLWTHETLGEHLREIAAAAAGNAVRYTLDFAPSNAPAFLTAPGPFVDLLTDAIREVTGLAPELSTTGGTSDARFIKSVCPVVEFGLVGRSMHMIDERTPVSEIGQLTAIYRRIIMRYFALSSAG